MTLNEIYREFTPGSTGFVKAIQTHSGMDISNEEIERLAAKCPHAEDFQNAWENENWWKDSKVLPPVNPALTLTNERKKAK